MTHIQQGWFKDLIYDHPEVFSLHDEDLGIIDQIKHTIPMTTDCYVRQVGMYALLYSSIV